LTNQGAQLETLLSSARGWCDGGIVARGWQLYVSVVKMNFVVKNAWVPAAHRVRGPVRSPSCLSIQNADAVLAQGTVTMFGELHGTEQSPAFVAAVVCNAAARDISATHAVELPYEATSALARHIRLDGSGHDCEVLFANEFWRDGAGMDAPASRCWLCFTAPACTEARQRRYRRSRALLVPVLAQSCGGSAAGDVLYNSSMIV
jgi:hypothetical protein